MPTVAAPTTRRRIGAVWITQPQILGGDNVAAMTLAELETVIRKAWSKDTSDDPDQWTTLNPARGQCGVTAMVIHQLLGGVLLVSDVFRDGARVETHYWNRLPSGVEIDLTREQFRAGETFGEPNVIDPASSREPKPESLRRVRLLSSRVSNEFLLPHDHRA
jgi:hypothetical protein